MSEKGFEDKMSYNNKSKLDKSKEDIKMPSLLKG